ncbi:MAG TPA: hypothetical protein VF503_21460 [Sphingobium sp.]|uniref:hypothetical protein n=1 Tax=Sphingobium sp. TaxID=1912891 RepID=UPI002ED06507
MGRKEDGSGVRVGKAHFVHGVQTFRHRNGVVSTFKACAIHIGPYFFVTGQDDQSAVVMAEAVFFP